MIPCWWLSVYRSLGSNHRRRHESFGCAGWTCLNYSLTWEPLPLCWYMCPYMVHRSNLVPEWSPFSQWFTSFSGYEPSLLLPLPLKHPGSPGFHSTSNCRYRFLYRRAPFIFFSSLNMADLASSVASSSSVPTLPPSAPPNDARVSSIAAWVRFWEGAQQRLAWQEHFSHRWCLDPWVLGVLVYLRYAAHRSGLAPDFSPVTYGQVIIDSIRMI